MGALQPYKCTSVVNIVLCQVTTPFLWQYHHGFVLSCPQLIIRE